MMFFHSVSVRSSSSSPRWGKNYITRRSFHKVHRRAKLDVKPHPRRRIHLRNNRNLGTFNDAQVARLIRLLRDPMDHRQSLSD